MVFVHLLCFLLEKSMTSVTTMVLDEWKARWDKVILLTQAITEKSIKKKKKTWKEAKTIASWSRLFNLTNLYEKWFKIHWLQIILFVGDVSVLFRFSNKTYNEHATDTLPGFRKKSAAHFCFHFKYFQIII